MWFLFNSKKWWFYTFYNLIILWLLIFFIFQLIMFFHFEKEFKLTKLNIIKHTPLILKDIAQLKQHPIFNPSPMKNNAEPLLSQYVSWDGPEINPSGAGMRLEEFLRTNYGSLNSPETIEKILSDDSFWKTFDPDWMTGLFDFDYLDLSTNRSVKIHKRNVKGDSGLDWMQMMLSLPVMKANELLAWTKIYALKQGKNGNAHLGLRMLRHTSQLLASSGLLLNNMMALAVLGTEKIIVDYFKVNDWSLISNESQCAYKRLSFAFSAFFSGPPFVSLPKAISSQLNPELGLCASVFESLAMGPLVFQTELNSVIWGEKDYRKDLTQLQTRLYRYLKECHSEKWIQSLNPIEIVQPMEAKKTSNTTSWTYITHWPYLRQLAVFAVLSAARVNSFKLYHEDDRCLNR